MADEPYDRLSVVLAAVAVEGGLILVAWFMGWLLVHPPLAHFSWDWYAVVPALLGTLPLIGIFLVIFHWPVGPLVELKRLTHEFLYPLLAPCSVVDLLGISLLAGVGEEMLFRGVLQAAFTDWLGSPWEGIALASLMFGLMHAITSTYAILATVLGAYLGWVWLLTDNLLVVILIHAFYDFFALLYLLRGPGRPPVPAAPVSDSPPPPPE
jgi:membrane protease YdiL (CAAX protease family)